MEDYWGRRAAARSLTSEAQAGEGSDENEREAWSVGEKLIIQAGERLILSARPSDRWEWEVEW